MTRTGKHATTRLPLATGKSPSLFHPTQEEWRDLEDAYRFRGDWSGFSGEDKENIQRIVSRFIYLRQVEISAPETGKAEEILQKISAGMAVAMALAAREWSSPLIEDLMEGRKLRRHIKDMSVLLDDGRIDDAKSLTKKILEEGKGRKAKKPSVREGDASDAAFFAFHQVRQALAGNVVKIHVDAFRRPNFGHQPGDPHFLPYPEEQRPSASELLVEPSWDLFRSFVEEVAVAVRVAEKQIAAVKVGSAPHIREGDALQHLIQELRDLAETAGYPYGSHVSRGGKKIASPFSTLVHHINCLIPLDLRYSSASADAMAQRVKDLMQTSRPSDATL